MSSAFTIGVPKVTKMLKKFKFWGVWGLALVPAPHAVAVPVQVLWQVPLNPEERYVLQISQESGFGKFLINKQVDGNGFHWDTPGEGVFHWRLMRPGKTEKGMEGSTFVSGSFVAVEAGSRAKPARISWEGVQDADRYKLYLIDETGRSRTMVSSTTTFTLPAFRHGVMIEIVPQSGGRRMFRNYHFQPSLQFQSGRETAEAALATVSSSTPPTPSAEAEAAQVAPPGPVAQTPSLTENMPQDQNGMPQTAASTTAPNAPAAAASVPPASEAQPQPTRRRRHLVYGMVYHAQDALKFSKLEVDLQSHEAVTGAGGGFWLNPLSGLIVSAQVGYHDHKGVMTQPERFQDQKLLIDQSRYTGTLDLGFNLLAPFELDSQVFSLALTAGATQLPTLPLRLSSETAEIPTFETRAYNLMGGQVAYGWLGDALAMMVDATTAQAPEDETKLTQGRLVVDFYPSERFAILVGGFYRRVETTRCDPDAARCLVEGKVRTTAQETGGFLGLGVVFK